MQLASRSGDAASNIAGILRHWNPSGNASANAWERLGLVRAHRRPDAWAVRPVALVIRSLVVLD
ncbi:MAG: hypothetical protein EA400_08135 [Chromatiaceae bacterium]|nr:MAG: hypothetical protein EA400_08135 [Chromatiaceae bacterium]